MEIPAQKNAAGNSTFHRRRNINKPAFELEKGLDGTFFEFFCAKCQILNDENTLESEIILWQGSCA
jgi:hypothetical protein